MKLNLGCGSDIRQGYTNVDFLKFPGVDQEVDLSLVWPWRDGSADEVLMLDFLEHFQYKRTREMLTRAWRVLRDDGLLVVQVPDFEHCAAAILGEPGKIPYMCNVCGAWIHAVTSACRKCGQDFASIQDAAVARLYGGQDRKGNWHHTTFTRQTLGRHLSASGFDRITEVELNENGQTFFQNWNIRVIAMKNRDLWSE